MSRPFLVAFDFDHTIVNDNTDTVARQLIPGWNLVESLKYREGVWTAFMAMIFKELFTRGIKIDEIKKAIRSIPEVTGMSSLISEAHLRNCEIIIVSDSNSLFINWWLDHNNLTEKIRQVYTNPARIENEQIHIEMYQNQDFCKLSEVNMCKGFILEKHVNDRRQEGVEFERIAYIGDGRNDFCPLLKLNEKDLAFPRSGFTLEKLINDRKNNSAYNLKAKVTPWTDAADISKKLFDL